MIKNLNRNVRPEILHGYDVWHGRNDAWNGWDGGNDAKHGGNDAAEHA